MYFNNLHRNFYQKLDCNGWMFIFELNDINSDKQWFQQRSRSCEWFSRNNDCEKQNSVVSLSNKRLNLTKLFQIWVYFLSGWVSTFQNRNILNWKYFSFKNLWFEVSGFVPKTCDNTHGKCLDSSSSRTSLPRFFRKFYLWI